MPVREIDANEIDWFDILPEPFVVLILGMRGAGKTALGHLLLELFSDQGCRKPAYIIGFPPHKRHLLPPWITPLDELYFPDNSVVLLHEAHFYLHARRSMAEQNIEIDKLITVSRHKNVDIIVETQQSFRLDRNIVAEVDAIIFRVLELMQEKFERPEVRWITEMAKKAFEPYIEEYVVKQDGKVIGRYRRIKPEALKRAFVYGKNYVGMYPHDIPLPSYWNDEISRAYGELREDRVERAKQEDPILRLVLEDPRYLDLLEVAVRTDIKKEKEGWLDSIGWEAYEIGATGPEMQKLRRLGVVKVVYKSNKHTGYKLVDRERVKQAIEVAKKLLS
ncbi:hypothetical protein TQ32_03845 [Pyrococcus kukulkanii]|uniref:Uncharacterized protein n=1 Tax=Pyrococcus kukulkanii TaxID=1609559 RepID=A0A127BAM1_9EURY|nr:hypothetical protein TQ32_03845 [Pyrococcus kukulkanii]